LLVTFDGVDTPSINSRAMAIFLPKSWIHARAGIRFRAETVRKRTPELCKCLNFGVFCLARE
jgi:hypothetical protein